MVFSIAGVSRSTLSLLPLFSSFLILPTICGTMKKKDTQQTEKASSLRQAVTEGQLNELSLNQLSY